MEIINAHHHSRLVRPFQLSVIIWKSCSRRNRNPRSEKPEEDSQWQQRGRRCQNLGVLCGVRKIEIIGHWLLCYIYYITGLLVKKGFYVWSLLPHCAFFRQMPPGKSLKEQLLKFVGLKDLYLFALAQGTKTCESRQCSVSENWCPGGE